MLPVGLAFSIEVSYPLHEALTNGVLMMICYISGGFYVKATGFSSGKPPFGVEDDGMITFTSSGSGRSVAASTILSWAYAAIA